jgi:hypothetical protein
MFSRLPLSIVSQLGLDLSVSRLLKGQRIPLLALEQYEQLGFDHRETKKADVAEHPGVFGHVGLLVNEPSSRAGVPFI